MKTFVRSFFRNPTISLVRVSLGVTDIHIPVASLKGTKPGPAVCITAGMDGDEYAGMAAAYELIFEFQKKQFAGSMTIIPIVNIPGFEGRTSYNPLDKKYPKYIYPGARSGGPTERLIYFLHTNYIRHAAFWLDMHDGAIGESLTPFVLAADTGNDAIDSQTRRLLSVVPSDIGVHMRRGALPQATVLGRCNCGYMLTESGQLGTVTKPAVNRHLLWAHAMFSNLGMIGSGKFTHSEKKIYRNIDEYRVRQDGLWSPAVNEVNVTRGFTLGTLRGLDGQVRETILSRHAGSLLWINTGLPVSRGTIVAGVGYEENHGK